MISKLKDLSPIPRRSNEPSQRTFDHAAYRERNRVERLFNRLAQHRASATCSEQRADRSAALLLLAAILLWLCASVARTCDHALGRRWSEDVNTVAPGTVAIPQHRWIFCL